VLDKVRLRRCLKTGRRLRIVRRRPGRGWSEPALFLLWLDVWRARVELFVSSMSVSGPAGDGVGCWVLMLIEDVPDVDEMQCNGWY